jgi:hypothetical protein
MREIGSEFWLDNIPTEYIVKTLNWCNIGEERILVFSGRTAIDYILEDMPKDVQSVYMPSYCCYSMIQPFLDREIHIDFYDVICDDDGLKYTIDYEKSCDIFVATSYFGFSSTTMDLAIGTFSNKGVTVIEDITHRLLSDQAYCNKADYNVASLRKWFAIPSGGLAIKQRGTFKEQQLKSVPQWIETKIVAMRKKAVYLLCRNKGDYSIQEDNKQTFLNLFSEFNDRLQHNYKGIEIDGLSKHLLFITDIAAVKKRRRDNAHFLYEAFSKHQFVKPLINGTNFTIDCPLFFPVRVNPEARDAMRNYLINNQIYCAIHWPIPNESQLNYRTKRVYDEELSLVCDQRYDIDDMARIVHVIDEFWSIS